MIDLFTKLLKDYLVQQNVAPDPNAQNTTSPGRVTLGAPDRTFVQSLPQGQSVNIYLADLRENRKLRSNERRRAETTNGHPQTIRESLYPSWVDAHYLITAWDTSNDQSTRAINEHKVLRAISSALLAGDPFTPREVYTDPTDAELASVERVRAAARAAAAAAGATLDQIVRAGDQAADAERKRITDDKLKPLNAWPPEFRLPGLPYQVLPPEGFPKLSEFWTTMGTGSVWKAVIYLVAAVPVEVKPQFEFPMVTTMKSTIGQTSDALGRQLIRAVDEDGFRGGTDHDWYQIGGFVTTLKRNRDGTPDLDSAGNQVFVPVVRAKAILQTLDASVSPPNSPPPPVPLQETRTDEGGKYQFVFAGPLPGEQRRFQVLVQKFGLKADPLDVVLTPAVPFPHDIEMQPA